ncbi:DUF3110 domain-containing protein [Thermoleptolyngbya sichuanensis A183]|uniref:DUF3110 domain-containing protein n=1 Tax=Thermoleptolyngbya sichuanensis A183 TaxID=2737172 RepID=A0A6M8B1L9_9CYAN|nr:MULTISPECIES: DUF3110 domain-containing protein [Thermoleptolyngbya]QKD80909.1 DUF3110 domain-containing protein [Thermoleptolyngbya sichuanensis A183]
MQVYVLLFNAGTENEGIHTLKIQEGDRNVVLMFESEDDATRYGLMLEAQDFLSPAVECFESEEIEEFCEGAHYECVLVPEGTLALPPETNVEELDWNPEDDGRSPHPKSPDSETSLSTLSDAELERIRRQLEGLL